MLFNSIDFLLFFPVAALVYYLVPHKARHIWLLLCSYYFYMCWNPVYALLLLASTVATFFSGALIGKIEKDAASAKKIFYKRCCLAACFIVNLGILAFFKYSGFILKNLQLALSLVHVKFQPPAFDILLPVGISFYTFQALSYTADVYRGEIPPERNFLKYALFVSFFPQLVAGPIERSGNLLAQINERHRFQFENVRNGLMLMLWGFFLKMVVADKTAIIVDAIYGGYENYSGWTLVVATALFAVQIYCDFFGYSTIALGAAKAMGFRLTDNFNVPYMSRSTSEFWRRWHITLFEWFKDYIYIPLGGSRKGKLRKYCNIMAVFLVSGLWHGAAWKYVVWGALNGLWQIIGDVLKPFRARIKSLLKVDSEAFSHKLLQMLVTFVLVDFTWIFFRAPSALSALKIIRRMFPPDNPWIFFDDSLLALGLDWKNMAVLFLSIAVLIFADFLKYKGIVVHKAIARQGIWLKWPLLIGGVVAVILFGVWGSGYDALEFIYFQF